MDRGRGGRRLYRRASRSAPTDSSIFRPRSRPRRRRRNGSPAEGDLTLAAVDAEALGTDLRWEPSRGGALFPHLYAPLPMSAVVWSRPLPLGSDGAMFSGALRREAGQNGRPGSETPPGGDGPSGGDQRLEDRSPAQRALFRSAPGGRHPGTDVSQSARSRRRLRQERRGSGRDAQARFRLRRGRHADAAAAGRQRPPAPVPVERGRRGHQPVRLQQ